VIIDIVVGLLIILAIPYGLFALGLMYGLSRLREGRSREQPFVSVIVAARDEEHTIGTCLASLLNQDYPLDKYEVIVVDDNSSDRTAEVVLEFASRCGNVKLISVSEGREALSPKKRAITAGIREGRGEIILITDADCSPPEGWISGMMSYFEPEVGVVAGFSPPIRRGESGDNRTGQVWQEAKEKIHPDTKAELRQTDAVVKERGRSFRHLIRSLGEGLFELESLASAAIAAGGIGMGRAITCVGRNLGYRRRVFEEVGGFGETGKAISGDDDLFIQRVGRRTDWGLRFAVSRETFVPTLMPAGPREFISRKRRHISAGLFYSPSLITTGVLVYLFNLTLLITLPAGLLLGQAWPPFICLSLKFLLDLSLLARGTRLFGRRGLLWLLPLTELIHIPYLVIIEPLALFGRLEWKGRNY